MKKAAVIFAILFILTLSVPMIATFTKESSKSSTKELVTIFSGEISSYSEFR